MKICDAHWQDLKKAIDDRGLTRFIAKDGEAAAKAMASQIQGGDEKESYDPLMGANFAIWGNALEVWGPGMMQEGAPCPLCLLDKHAKECAEPDCQFKQTGADWVTLAADAQMEYATELGLLGKPN